MRTFKLWVAGCAIFLAAAAASCSLICSDLLCSAMPAAAAHSSRIAITFLTKLDPGRWPPRVSWVGIPPLRSRGAVGIVVATGSAPDGRGERGW